jgi:hypothetical protein
MTFRKAADGVTEHGKTKGTNLGDSGPSVGIEKGPKKGPQKLGNSMKAVGRNMARAMLQKSAGRGR